MPKKGKKKPVTRGTKIAKETPDITSHKSWSYFENDKMAEHAKHKTDATQDKSKTGGPRSLNIKSHLKMWFADTPDATTRASDALTPRCKKSVADFFENNSDASLIIVISSLALTDTAIEEFNAYIDSYSAQGFNLSYLDIHDEAFCKKIPIDSENSQRKIYELGLKQLEEARAHKPGYCLAIAKDIFQTLDEIYRHGAIVSDFNDTSFKTNGLPKIINLDETHAILFPATCYIHLDRDHSEPNRVIHKIINEITAATSPIEAPEEFDEHAHNELEKVRGRIIKNFEPATQIRIIEAIKHNMAKLFNLAGDVFDNITDLQAFRAAIANTFTLEWWHQHFAELTGVRDNQIAVQIILRLVERDAKECAKILSDPINKRHLTYPDDNEEMTTLKEWRYLPADTLITQHWQSKVAALYMDTVVQLSGPKVWHVLGLMTQDPDLLYDDAIPIEQKNFSGLRILHSSLSAFRLKNKTSEVKLSDVICSWQSNHETRVITFSKQTLRNEAVVPNEGSWLPTSLRDAKAELLHQQLQQMPKDKRRDLPWGHLFEQRAAAQAGEKIPAAAEPKKQPSPDDQRSAATAAAKMAS